MKLALVISALAVALTGCGGGGGGGGSSGSSTPALASSILITKIGTTGSTSSAFIPTLVSGEFAGDGSKYAVVSGWYVNDLSGPPVKIYKLNSDGSSLDATVAILGSEFSFSVMYPVVADFNKDGIDDIFFPGFTDAPGTPNNPSTVFISRKGQSHQRYDLTDPIWAHASVAVDLDGDGDLDVISNEGHAWINNGSGIFTYRKYSNSGASGVCAGDFNNTGRSQLVFTDSYDSIQDTYIYEVNTTYTEFNNLTKVATLPVSYFDKDSTTQELSHDVSCIVADFNNDGRPDIVIVSASNSLAILGGTSPPQSYVQVYINQGNYVFTELSGFGTYNSNTLSSYTPKVMDFNNDGKPDIWLGSVNAWQNNNSNQFWINDGTGLFAQQAISKVTTILDNFRTLHTDSTPVGNYGVALPIKIDGKWNLVFTGGSTTNQHNIGYAVTQWTF
jgi:hypothetical protein